MLVKKLKGRTSHHLQQDYPELRKRYWGQHFWAVGYGAWSTGSITEQMVQEYLEHHKETPNAPSQNWILEKD
jgi:putative transposase